MLLLRRTTGHKQRETRKGTHFLYGHHDDQNDLRNLREFLMIFKFSRIGRFSSFPKRLNLQRTGLKHDCKMPILEEISDADDIDNLEMDLAEFDPNLKTAFAPKLEKTVVRSQDREEPPLFPPSGLQDNFDLEDEEMDFGNHKKISPEDMAKLKGLQLLYPCYFDKNRSHKQGRRVPKELAVENPLAHVIAEACSSLYLTAVFEPEKSHPQDWGNPGRVRVALKHNGKPESILANNKRHLLNQIARYLQNHPTTLKSLDSLPKPADFKDFEAKEIPKVKGFKMNTIVPAYSKLTLGHPMTKSIYEERPEVPVIPATPQTVPKQKNKYMHVRR